NVRKNCEHLLTRNHHADVPSMRLPTRTHEGMKREHQCRERPDIKTAAKSVLVHKQRLYEPNVWSFDRTLEVDATRVSKARVEGVRGKTGGRHAQSCFYWKHLESVGKLRQLIPADCPSGEQGAFVLVEAVTR